MKKDLHIIIAAGGTGGHISPAIAISENLIQKKIQVTFITLEKNINYPSFEQLKKNIPFIYYQAPLIPRSIKTFFLFFIKMRKSLTMLRSLKNYRPDAMIAFGGYPVFPALIWAKLNKVPFYLHEQNSVSGLITRLFSKSARYLIHSFPRDNYKNNEIFLGNPLRSMFTGIKKSPSRMPKTIKKIFITGGSQGAKDLNELYLNLIQDNFFKNVEFTLSTGPDHYEEIISKSRKSDKVSAFINEIDKELIKTDLIFCRSGSGSVYESLWAQKPVIFFPFPFATDNHQAKNAISASDNRFFYTLDIRPFNPSEAVSEVKKIILQMESEKGSPRSKLPLDADKTIPDFIIKNLNS